MSRHRDVRNMDYTEDYDGYDDVYGHSVDDDYCISPSNRQFIYNRENSRDQPKIGEFMRTEQDIQEEDESDASELSDIEKAKVESCLEQVRSTLGHLNTPKSELVQIVISNKFNIEKILNVLLEGQVDRKEKDVTDCSSSKFVIPKLNGFNANMKSSFNSNFVIPKLSLAKNEAKFTIPKINSFTDNKFNNLSELVSNHLSKSLKNNLTVDSHAKDVSDMTENVKELKISSQQSTSKPEYSIDLSVALKSTPSGHSLSGNKSKENIISLDDFKAHFIDCDNDLRSSKDILKCSFDAKDTLKLKLNNIKPASNFGKILCLHGQAPIQSDLEVPSIKVVASGKTTTNVVKGFDLSQKDKWELTPRSQSPASGRATPITAEQTSDESKGARRENKVDVAALYKRERGEAKENIYMVVIGHVDAGKSTLMGRLLYDLGQVNQKTMHKYEQESKKLGKQSFMYAWVLDETGEERNRGITMDVGRSQFETKSKLVTLLDAPGHKDFIPNMIAGAGQADVALLVVDATRGEFETGFDYGGQTREHALLVRSLGVNQLAVAINKLDTVSWSKERFEEISQKLKTFLKQAGFRDSDVTFVPCSGLTGQNLIQKPTENELMSWYSGLCLLEVIDNFRTPERPVSKPFRLSVNDVFKSTGSGFCVSGRIETGSLTVGDRVMICPRREVCTVKSLFIEEASKTVVFAGDQATVTLSGMDMQNVSIGNILCDPQNPVQVGAKFEARIVVFNLKVPITKGFSVILHHQSLVEPAVVSKLVSHLNRSSGELIKKHPRFLNNNTSAIVQIAISRPIALELYSDCKELGRFMLRVGGVTIAAGLITKIFV